MKELKYEYLLHQWGGFWNPLNLEIHKEPNVEYKWFNTKEKRQIEINRLEEIRSKLGTWDACIVTSLEEGYLTRYKFIIKSLIIYKGQIREIVNDLGYGFASSPEKLDILLNNFDYMKEYKWDIDIYNQLEDLKDSDLEVKRLITTVDFVYE
jgi:hypothetical protein